MKKKRKEYHDDDISSLFTAEYLVFSSLFIRRIIFVPRQLYSHARSLLNGSAIVSDFETPSAFCSSSLLSSTFTFFSFFFYISLFCSKSLLRKDPAFIRIYQFLRLLQQSFRISGVALIPTFFSHLLTLSFFFFVATSVNVDITICMYHI